MKLRLPDLQSSCEYTEQAVVDRQQGVVLQAGGWAEVNKEILYRNNIKMNLKEQGWEDVE
jgi:hypothetical protein